MTINILFTFEIRRIYKKKKSHPTCVPSPSLVSNDRLRLNHVVNRNRLSSRKGRSLLFILPFSEIQGAPVRLDPLDPFCIMAIWCSSSLHQTQEASKALWVAMTEATLFQDSRDRRTVTVRRPQTPRACTPLRRSTLFPPCRKLRLLDLQISGFSVKGSFLMRGWHSTV